LPMLRTRLADPAMSMAVSDGSWVADRQWCDAVDGTRALLLAPLPDGKPRVLMVTSALPREGKTTLSGHLAQSCARAGFRTLLVDADLRNPSVHRLLKVRPGPGLGELIAGTVEMREVVRNGPVDGLDIITGGKIDPANVPAAVQQVVPRLLEEFKQQYHVIIIDTPPILPVADALVLGPHTDGAVLSAMRDVSRVPAIRLACERLSQLRTPILGVVIAGLACHPNDYYHTAYSGR
jgi:polysaccharide biosynthesis transport protein